MQDMKGDHYGNERIMNTTCFKTIISSCFAGDSRAARHSSLYRHSSL